MAAPGIKYDDGSQGFATNCFPVRGLRRNADEEGGAWLVAHRAEQRRRFKAILCAKPRDYEQVREERKRSEKEGTTVAQAAAPPAPMRSEEEEDEDDGKILDGFFLMKHCCIEDPADLCSVNINGQGFSEVEAQDLQLFDNVAYVNASENLLSLEHFRTFPILRELELPLNGIRGIKLSLGDFPNLEMLDLSYNNLKPDDVLPLGLLPNLRVLHLTGNSLKTLPTELSQPYQDEELNKRIIRFGRLEVLMLDDNKFSDLTAFATLASLMRLKHLNLSKNEISAVPQLMIIDGRCITQDLPETPSGRKSKRSSRGSGRRSRDSLAKSCASPNQTRSKRSSPLKEYITESRLEHIPEGKEDATTLSNRTKADSQSGEVSAEELMKYAEEELKKTQTAETGAEPLREESKEDFLMEDLNLEELNLNDLESKVQDDMRRENALKQTTFSNAFMDDSGGGERGGGGSPPPFPELCHLNLSHNCISEEENLLAVAAWPMLSELLIHDNPLTTETVGDPPLLKRFLQERLGIHIQRKKPGPLPKPHIEVPQKPARRVKTKVPPIPRCNVDELLALEAPPKPALPEATPSPRDPTSGRLSSGKPLPPIPPTPPEGGRRSSEEVDLETPQGQDSTGDAFFMTQVDEPDMQSRVEPPTEEKQKPKEKKRRKKHQEDKDRSSAASSIPSKYEGYEELLDVDESALDEDIPMPKDIQGNIRALKYTLNHPLVFRENRVELDRPQKPFQPYARTKPPQGPKRKTKSEKTAEAIQNLKNRSTVVEAPLDQVLKEKSKYKKDFGDANQLLAEVQRRFNVVRENSMKEAREVRQILHATINDVNKTTGTGTK